MKLNYLILIGFFFITGVTLASKPLKVEFRDLDKKTEVFIGGKFFTSFIYPDNLEKQSLYPILTASGQTITRGFPLDPRPFERVDHPHHIGLWFNFGDVNGLDFWNNSYAIKPENKAKYGAVRFRKISSQNPKKGELIVASDWVDSNEKVLLHEETRFIFSGTDDLRTIERTSKLTAAQEVTFTENKEGMIGLRVDRSFEEPATKPERILDENAKDTGGLLLNNTGVGGVYSNAEGVRGADVWGKRSAWVALRAIREGEVITIAILDSPGNLNYPGWSHARGYGLFALNNLGGRAFDKNTAEVKLRLQKGESVTFKYKIIIGSGLTDQEIAEQAKLFN